MKIWIKALVFTASASFGFSAEPPRAAATNMIATLLSTQGTSVRLLVSPLHSCLTGTVTVPYKVVRLADGAVVQQDQRALYGLNYGAQELARIDLSQLIVGSYTVVVGPTIEWSSLPAVGCSMVSFQQKLSQVESLRLEVPSGASVKLPPAALKGRESSWPKGLEQVLQFPTGIRLPEFVLLYQKHSLCAPGKVYATAILTGQNRAEMIGTKFDPALPIFGHTLNLVTGESVGDQLIYTPSSGGGGCTQ